MHPSIKAPTIVSVQTGIMVAPTSSGAHIQDAVVKMASTGVDNMGSDVHIDHAAFHNIFGSALALGRGFSGASMQDIHRQAQVAPPGSNFTIDNVTIQSAQMGIEAMQGTNIMVTNSRIISTETGIMTGSNTTQVSIDKTLVQNTTHNPIMIGGSGLEITDSIIQNSGGSGVMVMGTTDSPINNVSIKNLSINQAANDPAMALLFGCTGIELMNVNHGLIKDSQLNGTGVSTGKMMTTGIKVTNSQGVNILDSVVQDTKAATNVMGISINNSATSSVARTEIIDNNSGAGATIGLFINAQSTNTEACNNKLSNNTGGTGSAGLMNESPSSIIFQNTAILNSENNIVGAPPLPQPPNGCCISNLQLRTIPPTPPPCNPLIDPQCTVC
jgi:hypothetical protein